MGLPTPEELDRLSGLVIEQGKLCHGKWEKFKGVLKGIMINYAMDLPGKAVDGGAKALGVSGGYSAGFQVAGFTVGTTIAPISAALAPWIGAATIASQAGKIFSLHDIKADALKKGTTSKVAYKCHCGNCAKNIGYILDKKERNVALVAVGVATFGISALVKTAHSIGKKVKSKIMGEQRPKEMTCRGLVESARGGCTTAMATIFLLSGSWSLFGKRDYETMATAVAIITSEDGWDKLQSLW